MNQQIRQSEPPGLNDQHPEQLAFEFIPFMFKKQQMQPGMNHQKDLKSPDKTSRVWAVHLDKHKNQLSRFVAH